MENPKNNTVDPNDTTPPPRFVRRHENRRSRHAARSELRAVTQRDLELQWFFDSTYLEDPSTET